MKFAIKNLQGALRSVALILATLLALVVGLTFGTSAASATVFEGGTGDPSGDGTAGPARDLVSAAVAYDNTAGSIIFEINLAAPDSDAPAQFATGVGTLNANGVCSTPLGVVGALRPSGQVVWAREDNGQIPAEADGEASIEIDGSRVTFTASDSELAGLTPNCGEAVLSNSDGTVVFDTTDAFAVAPRPTKPNLNLTISGPAKVRPGGKAKVKVVVGNTGDGAANGARVSLSAKGPGSVKPRSRKAATIGPNGSASFAFTVKAGRKAKGKIKLRAKVTSAGTASAAKAKTIKVQRRSKKPKPPGPGGKNGLTGRIFWGFEEYRWDRSSEILGLYFSNSKFVHWGVPKGGLPNCSKVTAKPDEDGEMQPGCLRYSFNSKTGRIAIG